VANASEAAFDSILAHVVEVTTGLSRRHLEGLGGIVVAAQDGSQLLQWTAATRFCGIAS
jgi:hypothetical protein